MKIETEREYAAVKKFIIDHCNNIHPYYNDIPNGFRVPCVYFPPLEVNTTRETLDSYGLSYFSNILFFGKDSYAAFENAITAADAISKVHCKIPLYNEDGTVSDEMIRLKQPEITNKDKGVYALEISWLSQIVYDAVSNVEKIQDITIDLNLK